MSQWKPPPAFSEERELRTGVQRILCCNVLQNECAQQDSIFRHPIFAHDEALPWPPENWRELCCWHCCHLCPGEPFCLPNSYDRRKDVFHVFGIFCSLPCAKAYLAEHSAFASGDRALLLHTLAARFFEHPFEDPVKPAPPRHRLKMFGGDMSIEAFREEHLYLTTTLSPPLISTPEVYERYPDAHQSQGSCMRGAAVAPMELLGRRSSEAGAAAQASSLKAGTAAGGVPGLFGSFAKQKRAPEAKPDDVPGTLCVFMKRKKS